jgi:hypothetical protein
VGESGAGVKSNRELQKQSVIEIPESHAMVNEKHVPSEVEQLFVMCKLNVPEK